MLLNLLIVSTVLAAWVQAATYTVYVGLENSMSRLSAPHFFPNALTIKENDTIIFKQNAQDIHTVTFFDYELPVPDVFYNGVIVNFTVAGPTPLPGGVFTGGFASSGIMDLDPNPPFPDSWTVKFGAPGTFKFVCAVHGAIQNGTITVLPASSAVVPPSPMKVAKQTKKNIATVLAHAMKIHNLALKSVKKSVKGPDGNTTHYVRVGYDAPPFYSLLGFFPPQIAVKPFDKITWYGATFHTVTFLNGAAVPLPIIDGPGPGQMMINPAWFDVNGTVLNRNDVINAGLLLDPLTEFTLTVGNLAPSRKPITYICLPHHPAGMKGEVIILKK